VQTAVVSTSEGGVVEGSMKRHMHSLCRAPFQARANDPSSPLMTITLTEFAYQEAMACRPPAACRPAGNGKEGEGEEGGALLGAAAKGGAGALPIRYAVGVA
jgi:hypothetical protein